jgi:hypothetical protein
MLYLVQNTTNTIILSLIEKVTISNPTFLFRFVHKETLNEYTCICAIDTLYSQDRQSFNIITKSTTPSPLAGELQLIYGDEYNYYIYAQASTTNLNYTLADELVEEGIMKFSKTITPRNKYARNTTTRKSYIR